MPPKRNLPSRLETDPKKMLEQLVGLSEVFVLGLFAADERVELRIESISEPPGCAACGVAAQAKDWREIVLVDLQFAGKPAAQNPPQATVALRRGDVPQWQLDPNRTIASPTPGPPPITEPSS